MSAAIVRRRHKRAQVAESGKIVNMFPRVIRLLTWTLVLLAPAAPAWANQESQALRAKAAASLYNLEHDQALATFRQAVAADPQDAAAHRGLAAALWLSITYRRGNMTVDDYLGRISKPAGPIVPPPPEAAAAFKETIERAITLARQRITRNPRDAEAHYQLGAAVGLRASYIATVEASAAGAFRAAREAYDENERVLSLDPSRKDAGLIVGTYRYIVATLSLPLRWVAYVAGFGGDGERGLRLIEGAAEYGSDNQTDARFALLLLYNREKRYDDALKQLAVLREQYPRNRLMWLESGSTCLRAGRVADAERFLEEGSARFADDRRPRMFGEDALWHYKLGTARAWSGRSADAQVDLRQALRGEGRPWVRARAHLELGRLALVAKNTAAAREEFQSAIKLAESDNDPATADEARKLSR
jgi:tetratricopeptide (TPR) repeat protein